MIRKPDRGVYPVAGIGQLPDGRLTGVVLNTPRGRILLDAFDFVDKYNWDEAYGIVNILSTDIFEYRLPSTDEMQFICDNLTDINSALSMHNLAPMAGYYWTDNCNTDEKADILDTYRKMVCQTESYRKIQFRGVATIK